ncbi:MAG: metal ABC transporter permease [Acidobacteriota bacterium]
MIQNFLSSWELFHNTYLAGWLIGLALSLVGVLVVARDQIFIGAAVSQASALGVALAMFAASVIGGAWGARLDSDSALSGMAVLFSVTAALLTSFAGKSARESHEAITGWVFLVSASVSVLVVSHSPHGLEEIQHLISSSIIGATDADVWLFAALAAATILLLAKFNRRILLLATDPVMADAVGMRTLWWDAAIAAWLGLCIGLSIRVSGMLFTFGFLVLPALVAKNLCREIRPMFVVAPVVALTAAVAGFVLANEYDFPPGQMSVSLLAGLLPLAWLIRASVKLLVRKP